MRAITHILLIDMCGVMPMSKPRRTPGTRNIVGTNVTWLRIQKGLKQKELAARLQSMGMDICESALSRLECQQRLVQDYELIILAEALDPSVEKLLEQDDKEMDPSG